MKIKPFFIIIKILFLAVIFNLSYGEYLNAGVAIEHLIKQVEERSCDYKYAYRKCEERPFWDIPWFYGPKRHTCVMWAARCIGTLGDTAQAAVPALTKALREGPNDYDTGDGTVNPRSAIANTLEKIGDPSTIPFLIEAFDHAEPRERGGGALKNQPLGARYALLEAIASFGPLSISAAPSIAAILRESNEAALSFPSPREIVEKYKKDIKITGLTLPTWLEEKYKKNEFGELAAETLGKIGATETVPLLIESLQNKWIARGAADGLALLGEPARLAIPDLRKVLKPTYDPSQRQAAAKALGRLKDLGSLHEITKGIEDDALFDGYINALQFYGSAADPAVKKLSKRLERPTGVVQKNKGVYYSVEAGRENRRQIKVIKTLGSIGTTKAFNTLANSLTDPELGAFACEELQKLDHGEGELNRYVSKISAKKIQRYNDMSAYVNPCLENR